MIRACCFPLFCLTMLVIGCQESAPSLPPTVPVKGTVNLDGKVMAEGEIVFAMPGQPGIYLPVANGTYAGDANIGKNKVEIRAFKANNAKSGLASDVGTKMNYLPAQYNTNSKLEANVIQSGANEFKFDVKSK